MRQLKSTMQSWIIVTGFAVAMVGILGFGGIRPTSSFNTTELLFTAIALLFAAETASALFKAGAHTVRLAAIVACGVSEVFRRQMIVDLDSPRDSVRRRALQILVDFHDAPVGDIHCWPRFKCTELQVTTMEAVFGRWLEARKQLKKSTEQKMVDVLFDFAPEKDAPNTPCPSPKPAEAPIHESLDALANRVKDAILDWNAETFSEEEEPANEDATLGALPREPYIAALREKVTEAVEHVADLLAEVPNVRSLAACEPSVGEILADLRGEAVALALEMRGVQETEAGPRTRLDPPHAPFPRWLKPDTTWPRAPEFPGGWVKKYRRIRRAGL
jgi:hypothetical protein